MEEEERGGGGGRSLVVVAVYLLSWGDSEETTGTETLVRLVGTEDIDG